MQFYKVLQVLQGARSAQYWTSLYRTKLGIIKKKVLTAFQGFAICIIAHLNNNFLYPARMRVYVKMHSGTLWALPSLVRSILVLMKHYGEPNKYRLLRN